MASVMQVLRSDIAGSRPSGRQPGELYINFADGVFGYVDSEGNSVDIANGPADLSGYLPLTGGTLTGNVDMLSTDGSALYIARYGPVGTSPSVAMGVGVNNENVNQGIAAFNPDGSFAAGIAIDGGGLRFYGDANSSQPGFLINPGGIQINGNFTGGGIAGFGGVVSSQTGLLAESATPYIRLTESDQAANKKTMQMNVSGGILQIQALRDNNGVLATVATFERDGSLAKGTSVVTQGTGDARYMSLSGGIITGANGTLTLGNNSGPSLQSVRTDYPIVSINTSGSGLHIDGTGSASRLFRLIDTDGVDVFKIEADGSVVASRGVDVYNGLTVNSGGIKMGAGTLTIYNSINVIRDDGPSYFNYDASNILIVRQGEVEYGRFDQTADNTTLTATGSVVTRGRGDARYARLSVLDSLLQELEVSSVITPEQRTTILASIPEDPPEAENME